MIMNNRVKELLVDIANYVLTAEYSSLGEEYMLRLSFLYSLPLENLLEVNSNVRQCTFIDEVKQFEKREIKFNLIYLDEFKEMTSEVALQIFSILSYQLAKNRIQGHVFQQLSYLSEKLYMGLITGNSIDVNDKQNNEVMISETLLDFDFASCKSDNTSFRLLHYIDAI